MDSKREVLTAVEVAMDAALEKVKNETENHYMKALESERENVKALSNDRDIIMAERDSIGFQLKAANEKIVELQEKLRSDLHLERQISCEYEVLSGYESLVSSLRAELADAKLTWGLAREASVDAAAKVLHNRWCQGKGTAHCCKAKPEKLFYETARAVLAALRSDVTRTDPRQPCSATPCDIIKAVNAERDAVCTILEEEIGCCPKLRTRIIDRMHGVPREEKSIRQSLEEFRITRYGVPVQLASSGAEAAGDDDGTRAILTNPSLVARIVSIFPDLVAYAGDFRAMCDEWEKDGAGEPSRRKPRAGLSNATIDEAKVLFGEAKDFCRRVKSMSGMIQVVPPPSPQMGHLCTGCQNSAKALIQKDRVLFALKDAAAAFKKIAEWAKYRETWGVTLDSIEVEAAYWDRFLSAYDENDGKLSPAESRQFARGLRESARIGREEEIMVTIEPGSAHETKKAWGIKVVESLCKMLEAKAAAIEGEARP